MLVTVLTPTYNRGYIIQNLYKSLLKQTNKNFEWVVIDDGSNDETTEFFNEIIQEKSVDVFYKRKENGGKHTALNCGYEFINGEITIIVDSDDQLSEDAIEKIINEFKKINDNDDFLGVAFRIESLKTGKIIGKNSLERIIDTNSIDYKYNMSLSGDLAECFKSKILIENKFPTFKGENFVPEALIWNRLALKYKMRFINEAIYYGDYLEDGLSQQFNKLRKNNFEAYNLFYREEMLNKLIPLKRKILSLIRLCEINFKNKVIFKKGN